jgi:hypothetical protein
VYGLTYKIIQNDKAIKNVHGSANFNGDHGVVKGEFDQKAKDCLKSLFYLLGLPGVDELDKKLIDITY